MEQWNARILLVYTVLISSHSAQVIFEDLILEFILCLEYSEQIITPKTLKVTLGIGHFRQTLLGNKT